MSYYLLSLKLKKIKWFVQVLLGSFFFYYYLFMCWDIIITTLGAFKSVWLEQDADVLLILFFVWWWSKHNYYALHSIVIIVFCTCNLANFKILIDIVYTFSFNNKNNDFKHFHKFTVNYSCIHCIHHVFVNSESQGSKKISHLQLQHCGGNIYTFNLLIQSFQHDLNATKR